MESRARILVVEDEGIVAMDIQSSLESLGYLHPEIAFSGEEAMEKAVEFTPNLLLMDIRLGEGMDGVDTAMCISEVMDVPVVYLTAYTDDQTLERAKITQPFGYLVKPFSQKELQTTIEMALYKHSMERELKQREQWLEATLRSIGDGVVATRSDGKILFMNPKAQALTGWLESDAMDRDVEWVLPFLDSQGKELTLHPGREALRTGRPVTAVEGLNLVSRYGKCLPVDDSAAPIQGPRGRLEGMVMVIRDATRRKEWERAQQEIGERANQAGKMDAMGRLAGGIAHDFNNHLSVIMGMSEMLAADLRDEPERQGMLEEIRKACRNSVGITRQLQAFARRKAFQLTTVDLNEAVRDGERILRRVMSKDIRLQVNLAPSLQLIRTDRNCLDQVLMNLALNAGESMPRGGVLSFSTAMEVLDNPGLPYVFPLVPGPYAVLQVGDTGHGISYEVRPFIFEPFFTTKGKQLGAGLGLATVYGMVKHIGGNIQVDSEPGQGCTFSIYFPIIPIAS